MACAPTHSAANLCIVAAAAYVVQPADRRDHAACATAGVAAACMPSLPDLLEPAVHPNHRQFFHSVTFAGLIGVGIYRAYRWQPENDWEKLARAAILVTGAAYLAHLLVDATTAKSLPMVGR